MKLVETRAAAGGSCGNNTGENIMFYDEEARAVIYIWSESNGVHLLSALACTRNTYYLYIKLFPTVGG